MTDGTLVLAETPGGDPVVVRVVDLDGSAPGGGEQKVAAGLPNLSGALRAVDDFAAGLRTALRTAAPRRTTVEFSIGFAMQAGKITAMFVDGRADASVTVTLEWDRD